MLWNNENLIKVLQNKGVVVMPTDTIYGIVGVAQDKNVVDRIYDVRKRNENKPCIILISDITEIEKFNINLTLHERSILREYWPLVSKTKLDKPEPVSIILDCLDDNLFYLHRGTNTLAFRVPENEELRMLLSLTGPLVAPSANIEGLNPAKNIDEAKGYFGDRVDFYLDGGEVSGKASKVIKLKSDGGISVLRG